MVDQERAAKHLGREAGLAAARAAFYEGDIAKSFADFQRENGGLLTEEDMASYQVTVEPPISYNFRGMTIFACGPWCQGPMLLQELSILKDFDLAAMGHNSEEYIHTLIEAIKLAALDRETYYGDPKFVDVPIEMLLSDKHSRELRSQITHHAKEYADPYGLPIFAAEQVVSNRDTTYVSAVDQWGNAFSATPSDGVMRSHPVVPGLGMAVSPRGIQSRLDARHPASVQPGKRPRLTPNPAMAVRGDEFVMAFGTPGGDLQTQSMLQFLLNITEFGMAPQAAIEAPRVYSFGFPDSFAPHPTYQKMVRIEPDLPEPVSQGLAKRGHVLRRWPLKEPMLTSVCAVIADREQKIVEAAADFRRTAYGIAS